MGEKLAFCRVRPPHPLQKLHDRLFLLFPRHHGFRDVLMVSVQARARFFKRLVRHAAAADINSPKGRVIPGIDDLGASGIQYCPHSLLDHFHIVRLNAFKPVPVALLRPNGIRHPQENPHSPVRVQPGPAALFQLNGPNAGSGALQNVFQAPSGLQLVFLFPLHQGVDIPQGKDRAVLRRRPLRSGKVNLQIL